MRPRYLFSGMLLAFVIAGATPARAQFPWQKKAKAPPPPKTCYAGFPSGLPRLYSGVNTKYLLDYQVNFTYQSADATDIPELAKMFTMTLNDASAGSGLEFEQAEGVAPNLRIVLTANHNNTVPDHFSLVVQIFGSPEVNLNNGQSTPISYFVLNNAPFTYTDGGKMVEDAGILTANYFKNGWACPK
jgi:hypothetical protein